MATLTMASGRNERGQAVIEMALTLPLLLLVVFGIFDFGFMFQRYEVVTNAAREGARLAILPEYTIAEAKNRMLDYLSAGGVSGTVVAAPCTGGALSSGRICVDVIPSTVAVAGSSPPNTVSQMMAVVEYDHTHAFVGPIMKLFGGTLGTVRLRAASIMRKE
jgi:Flp pilus assembly protein TadG